MATKRGKAKKKNPCWKGYTAMGDNGQIVMKKKGNKMVPACRPIKGGASMKGDKKKTDGASADVRKTIGKGKNFNKANPTGTGAKAGGGMTQKGVNEYKRKNPGSKLKTAVTKDPSKLKPGSKDAKRRKSFCARSKSWDGERGRAARRRWNC